MVENCPHLPRRAGLGVERETLRIEQRYHRGTAYRWVAVRTTSSFTARTVAVAMTTPSRQSMALLPVEQFLGEVHKPRVALVSL